MPSKPEHITDPSDQRCWTIRDDYGVAEYRLEESGGELETRHRLGDLGVKPVLWFEDETGVVEVLDPSQGCFGYPPCGGCDRCTIAQIVRGSSEGYFYGFMQLTVTRTGVKGLEKNDDPTTDSIRG